MSHAPEHVDRYVCTECQVVHVGSVIRTGEGHRYRPPEECKACGTSEFVALEHYPRTG